MKKTTVRLGKLRIVRPPQEPLSMEVWNREDGVTVEPVKPIFKWKHGGPNNSKEPMAYWVLGGISLFFYGLLVIGFFILLPGWFKFWLTLKFLHGVFSSLFEKYVSKNKIE